MQIEQGMGRGAMKLLQLAGPLALGVACGLGLLVACEAASAVAGEAQHGEKTVVCTNLSSGSNWQIKIDYDHSTVDNIPATIWDDGIKWSTTDGAHYALDRKSGNLTVTVASTTGGFFLYDHCKLEN
jgi:hypothetical protein